MTRVLVIGGYGGFGGELSQRLAGAGHHVIVAGRSLAKAERFCAGKPGCRPAQADRSRGVSALIAAERPAIVVDASGPFQSAGYSLVEECISAGVSYVDLADARAFVTGITRYDDAARQAGVVVVSGASSVPALSGAVVRHLARDAGQVTAVEMAIIASNRASAGAAVTAAVIGGVGRPLTLWRGQAWAGAHGWRELRRIDIGTGHRRLKSRLVALADVPDLQLLPERLPGRPAVAFRAGTESRLGVVALWLASWAVRWRWVESISPLTRVLSTGHRLSGLWGGDRSGMVVRLFGRVGERRVERRWDLVAEAGDGPKIPSLAAALLVERIVQNAVPPGAGDAGSLLDLDAFEPAFSRLAVTHTTTELVQPPALYRRVLGPRFEQLPKAVQAMHDVLRDTGAHGRASVEVGRHPIARLLAKIVGFPSAGEHALHVHFAEEAGVERWTRSFSGERFASSLSQSRGMLVERFGPARFHFDIDAAAAGLTMTMRKWSFFGLRLPLRLAPQAPAREWEEDGLFHFDVPVTLPVIGRFIHYRGWLQLPPIDSPNC